MTKTIIIETFKKTWFYKLIKTSEAVLIGLGMILGIIFGWFDILPALVILGGYVALNALGLSNSEPYVVRDVIKEELTGDTSEVVVERQTGEDREIL